MPLTSVSTAVKSCDSELATLSPAMNCRLSANDTRTPTMIKEREVQSKDKSESSLMAQRSFSCVEMTLPCVTSASIRR
jgi:hypothetical protein